MDDNRHTLPAMIPSCNKKLSLYTPWLMMLMNDDNTINYD